MIKYILEYQKNNYDQVLKFSTKKQSELCMLFESFNQYNDWITVDKRGGKVHIWVNLDEDDYGSWEDIPKLTLSNKNYEHLVKQWNLNHEHPAKYLLFTMDDNGWIDLEAKDELSKEDQKSLKQEIQ